MNIKNSSSSESEFLFLQAEFRQQLPKLISDIDSLWIEIIENEDNADALISLTHTILGISDAAGTYGTDDVSYIARKSYLELKNLSGDRYSFTTDIKLKDKLGEWFMQLGKVSSEWLSTKEPVTKKRPTKAKKKPSIVYSLLGNNGFSKKLTLEVEKTSFKIKNLKSAKDIEDACISALPISIIIDADFKELDMEGVDLVQRFKENIKSCPPIIFVSDNDDTKYRLKLAKAGVDRYFCQPVLINKMMHAIAALNTGLDSIPYRILIIDDDIPLLKCYSAILSESNMVVQSESNSFKGYESISTFNPDVIILDMYMPDCSGKELISMVRQDDALSLIPIVFLSGEQDINNQLEAMELGAEDFLVKPVNSNKLVATVNTVAKRARNNIKLNKNLKDSLRENKSQLVSLDHHAIVSVTNIAGQIIHVNDKLCEISGYSRKELLGKNHRILKSAKHSRAFFQDLWGTISGGKIWHGVICNTKKKGGEYWVDSTIVPFLDEKGKPYKYVSIRTDMTKLRTSESRLNRSQDFANIGTWDWDIVSGELYWSDRIWTLFGYNKENTDTTYENFINAVHPEDRQLVIDAVTECSENGKKYDIEHRVVWPDESIHWLHESGDVVRGINDEPLHMLGVVRDITDLKKTELSMIESKKEAENANLAKSQFLSSMSHELRTPMNAIMGFSQLLKASKSQPLVGVQESNVEEIMIAGKHLMNLINEVLELSKIEAGHVEISKDNVDVNSIIKETLHLILPLAQNRGIEISIVNNNKVVEIDNINKEKCFAYIDKTRIKQVILNLLSNAVKYNNEGGGITLTYDIEPEGKLKVSIADTGEGLSQEQQEQLFTSFNRLGREQTKIEGSGIGLVITKKIIKLMGGEIGVKSKVGEGSTFFFEIPIVIDGDGYPNNGEPERDKIKEMNVNARNKQRTVLYVEDNPANLRLVEQILGCIPNLYMWSAPEPLLGLELASEHVPNLILLDINLPGMSGYEVLEKLRKQESTKNIPVIAISANAMPKDIEKGKKAGFNGYITKPVKVKELLAEVENKLPKT